MMRVTVTNFLKKSYKIIPSENSINLITKSKGKLTEYDDSTDLRQKLCNEITEFTDLVSFLPL